MTAFPKYPKYKASGVEWLGDVPEHWGVERLKGSLLEVDRRSTTGTETLLSLRMNVGLVPHNEVSTLPITTAQLIGYKKVAPGQVVMNRMRASSGIFAVATSHGLVSPDYAVFEPRGKQGTDYLLSLFKTGPMMTEFRRYSTGLGTGESGFLRLYSNFFFNIRCPIPPKAEEDRIVAFLDEKTAQIDALIAKKQRQIELLDEQKAILINRAVTRGLPSEASAKEAELQDSGIPWIGSIPKHWKVIKLKYLISIQAGYAFASSAYSHNAQDIRLLRGVNVNPGKITWNDVVYWPEKKMRGVEDFALAENDMVMGMDRPWVSSGVRVARITKADLPCLLLQRVARIRATKIEPDFLERVLTGSGFKSYFEPILTGVSVPHISPDQIGGYTAAVPPLPEQKAICSFINQAEALCSKVKATEESQIQTLQTLRSTLIAHAVTGKIAIPAATV